MQRFHGNNMSDTQQRLVIVSNRLPITISTDANGDQHLRPAAGGLVTAMVPVLRDRGGVWIGWTGSTEEVDLETVEGHSPAEAGYRLVSVPLSDDEVDGYYYGFSNEILWPLFHDFATRCNFQPEYWTHYQAVNRKFADVIAQNINRDDFLWVQDYHLLLVAHELRERGFSPNIGFFLHIPFPSLDVFLRLPWRFEILQGMLAYDLVGLQTMRDRRNFLQCVRLLMPGAVVRGKGQVQTVRYRDREVRVGAFPISIDFQEFAAQAASEEVAQSAWYIHEDLPNRKIVLGVDRLDYTKGIPERLLAFRELLRRYPETREQLTFVQTVVPSRADVPEYAELKQRIEILVSEINGEFTRSGWVPIHYLYRNLRRAELLAYYRTAEIALITPLKDGMNLVAKEYCACDHEGRGVLILSEFAGASSQLHHGALLVNPHDIVGVAEAIHAATLMGEGERRTRMRKLRVSIRRQDIYAWLDGFLRAAIAKDLSDFPQSSEYLPKLEERAVEGGVRSDDRRRRTDLV